MPSVWNLLESSNNRDILKMMGGGLAARVDRHRLPHPQCAPPTDLEAEQPIVA